MLICVISTNINTICRTNGAFVEVLLIFNQNVYPVMKPNSNMSGPKIQSELFIMKFGYVFDSKHTTLSPIVSFAIFGSKAISHQKRLKLK